MKRFGGFPEVSAVECIIGWKWEHIVFQPLENVIFIVAVAVAINQH